MGNELGQKNRRCVICEEEKQNGYYLCSFFICLDCERGMVHTEVEHPAYKRFIKQLKKAMSSQKYIHN
ncbi:sigma factor G inhibitor Gin [Fervidibacillus halotolerans]|uniref:Sigma factor G inhibitor Gin n=1 Tax=Fervidibacillus halotolerans TaxID=2980027 RepID=A0A9E8LZT9_9BACI|nr:sigma factor G inhibitor Gin [Fervidibacillus halotolerans]WAA12320.1 sigma factor G inhibitor Gin [Fervidibacillus halotolerans]